MECGMLGLDLKNVFGFWDLGIWALAPGVLELEVEVWSGVVVVMVVVGVVGDSGRKRQKDKRSRKNRSGQSRFQRLQIQNRCSHWIK
jgi:hypothetical protein